VNTKSRVFLLLKILVGGTVYGVIIYYLITHWNVLRKYELRLNFWKILLSFSFLSFSHFLSSVFWNWILRCLKVFLPIRETCKIYFLSQLGRYIPGKIWYLLGRIGMTRKYGISQLTVLLSSILEFGLVMASALIIFILSLIGFGQRGIKLGKESFLFLLLLLGLTLIILHPRVINKLLATYKREKLYIHLSYSKLILTLSFFLLLWVVKGWAFFLLISSVYPISLNYFYWITGSFAISWVTGYLAFLSPAGIGAREATLVFLLSHLLPLPINVIISSFLMRTWMMSTEFLLSLTGIKWFLKKKID